MVTLSAFLSQFLLGVYQTSLYLQSVMEQMHNTNEGSFLCSHTLIAHSSKLESLQLC